MLIVARTVEISDKLPSYTCEISLANDAASITFSVEVKQAGKSGKIH